VAVHESDERGVAAHQLDQARHIVLRRFQRGTKKRSPQVLGYQRRDTTRHDTTRHDTTHHHSERVRPMIALCPTGVRSGPGPIRVLRLHEPRLGIPHVSVALGPLEEDTSVIPSIHIGRDDSYRPIVICAGVSANGHGGEPGWTLLKYSEKDGRGCVDVWTWTGGNVTHTHSPESDCQLPNADRPRRSRDACTR
jgi:hypothetical protein